MIDPDPTLDEPDTDIEVIQKLRNRIEALEAALRAIADGSFLDGTIYDGIRTARAALAPEQGK